MIIAFVILILAVGALLVQVVRYEQELSRMARLLDERSVDSNARITTDVHTRGVGRLAKAINSKLDDIQHELIVSTTREREVRNTLTALSHDIRTPLAGAQGYLQLLAEEDSVEVRAKYLKSIARRQADVRQLLDELFVYAQSQDSEHRLNREPVDIASVLSESLVAFYPQFDAKGWAPQIEIDEDAPRILGDPDALARIFRNLTSNALRYGVAAPSVVQRGTTVTFANRVADSAQIDISRLFERFYQGSAARNGQGSGLGLAIAAELARALDATISACLEGDCLRVELSFPNKVQP